MSDLAATAERLRVVKHACSEFITLWALDCLMAETRSSDRFQRDLLNAPQHSENSFPGLYSGRGLDD
jgi:hypothetical protein